MVKDRAPFPLCFQRSTLVPTLDYRYDYFQRRGKIPNEENTMDQVFFIYHRQKERTRFVHYKQTDKDETRRRVEAEE